MDDINTAIIVVHNSLPAQNPKINAMKRNIAPIKNDNKLKIKIVNMCCMQNVFLLSMWKQYIAINKTKLSIKKLKQNGIININANSIGN